MSNTKHPARRAALITASSATLLLLGACSQSRTAGLTQYDQMVVLDEIQLQSGTEGYALHKSAGPVLVAGDSLAIQCASAGNYFEGMDWAPVYANVETPDFE